MTVSNISNASYINMTYGSPDKKDKVDEDTMSFDRALMGMKPDKLPSFVARVYTEQELYQYVDDKVQSNQDKKLSIIDMLRESCPEGTNATFKFVGESKIYSFFDFIDELERRAERNT